MRLGSNKRKLRKGFGAAATRSCDMGTSKSLNIQKEGVSASYLWTCQCNMSTVALVFAVASLLSCVHAPIKQQLSDEAARAYNGGDFATAERIWLELAQGSGERTDSYHPSPSFISKMQLVELLYSSKGKMPAADKELFWRIKAANQSDFEKGSQNDLTSGEYEHRIGDMFASGVGTPKDMDQACRWYERAYQRTDRWESILKRSCTGRSALLKELQDEDLARVQELRERQERDAARAKEEEVQKRLLKSRD